MNLSRKLVLQIFGEFLLLHVVSSQNTNPDAKLLLSSNDMTVIVGESSNLTFHADGSVVAPLTISFYENHEGIIMIEPSQFVVTSPAIHLIQIYGVKPGHVVVVGNSTTFATIDVSNLFIRVVVANSQSVILIAFMVGWIYFVAWSISFYPQIWINFKRKSVVGLNFDFLALNLLGHSLYALFNSSLYWNTNIEDEYFLRFPRGLIPVGLNDVVFSIHASVITFLTILQCFAYEKGVQRVSTTARSIVGIFLTVIFVSMILALAGVWHWLDFLNACSYIKLSITLIKYVPQAVMNYRRRSTKGWSIGNILLDFTGGMLSMVQMILNSYNFNDWQSIFGDPTKFGLGLFSVLFDILFIVQHYFLYRKPNLATDCSRSDLDVDSEKSEAKIERF